MLRGYPYSPRTYYVDATAGNNANTGTAENQAKQTIAAVNALALRPGDRVLFKRGETWSGTQWKPTVAISGQPGAPITFADYGSGALPVFTNPAGTSVAQFPFGNNWLRFRNLDFNNGTTYVVQFQGSHSHFDGCVFRGGPIGMHMGSAASGIIENNLLTNCSFHDCTQFGMETYHTGQGSIRNIRVEDCTAYSCGTTAAHHGIYFKYEQGGHIKRCTCYSNTGAGIKVNQEGSAASTPTTVEGNYCYSNYYGIYVGQAYAIVQNNVCYNNTDCGILPDSDCAYTEIKHNTLVNNLFAGLEFLDGQTGISNCIFTGNLIHQDFAVLGEGCMPVRVAGDGTLLAAQNTWNYNNYSYIGADSGYVFNAQLVANQTLAGWQAFGGSPDANSIAAEPVFVTEWTDLHIQTTSPCKNAVLVDQGVRFDKDGKLRDATPDIGAYEF